MKRFVLATSLLAGCTQNADIGIDDQPVTCMPNNGAAAEAHGTVSSSSASLTFGDTTVSLAFQPIRVDLKSVVGLDQAATMHLSFLCGQPTLTPTVEPVAPGRLPARSRATSGPQTGGRLRRRRAVG
jgi:hypothetical protein